MLLGSVGCAALFGGEDEVAVDLLHADAAEDGGELVAVPKLALDDHDELAADLETVEAFFNEGFGNGEIGMVGRVGQNPVKAGEIHGRHSVAAGDVYVGHAVARCVFPGVDDRWLDDFNSSISVI